MAAIGINPIYQRQRISNLVKRFSQKLLLFSKAESVDFRGMAIDRNRTKASDIGNITQMFSRCRNVDLKICLKGYQSCWYDAFSLKFHLYIHLIKR